MWACVLPRRMLRRHCPTGPGVARQSIRFARRWMRGSSPRMTGTRELLSGSAPLGKAEQTGPPWIMLKRGQGGATMAQARPNVVIVGAGFGGLEAAKALARAPVEVTVVDRQNHHCFQPLLYQVATATLSPAEVAWPIRHILRKQKNATVLMAEVRGVDPEKRLLRTNAIEIAYDYLVLATGATHSYFGHDEWAEVAPGLKRIEDATRIRRRILIAFERAELAGGSSPSRSSSAAPPASRWPAPSPRSRGRRWPGISAASIRRRRASC